jgi:hypothetical protein
MRMIQRGCIGMLLVSTITGCGHLFNGYSVQPMDLSKDGSYVKLKNALTSAEGGPLITSDCFNPPKENKAATDAAITARCTGQRNMAVAVLVIASDEACLAHRRSMYGREATWNVGLGTLTNLFAGAASVVSAETTKSVLAAMALFSNSERSLMNENVYKQMLVPAVDRKIVELRDVKMRAIYASLKQNLTAYSIHESLRDVIQLHNSCSFIDGLQKALQEGTEDTSTHKMQRLRANLLLVKAELSGETDKTGAHAVGLNERIKALNAALQAEELL